MSDVELKIGDRISLQHGPFVSRWQVVEVKPAGAVLAYVEGSVEMAGFDKLLKAPSGDVLTSDAGHEFLGRAHWPAVMDLETEDASYVWPGHSSTWLPGKDATIPEQRA